MKKKYPRNINTKKKIITSENFLDKIVMVPRIQQI
jgi:hypothetical protein